jgi:uncharacterized membrane protein YfhO
MMQKENYKKQKMTCFLAYDQVSKKNRIVFPYKEYFKKKNVLTCIFVLITSLLKSWELGQYFKNSKIIILFCFVLILRISLLYVRRTLDIKRIVFLLTLEWLGLTQ